MAWSDPDLVERWLRTVGYYRLSAYWLPYEVAPPAGATRSKRFKPGTTFENVVDIYIFDRKLRLLVMEAIERIEINLRSRWTNRLSLRFGPHAHLDISVAKSGWEHAELVGTLAKRVGQSSEVFVEHYKNKYTDPYMPPLWAVTELMTFGELSKWFKATKDLKIGSEVAKDLGMPSREIFESVVQVISYIRNICAHHGRLWNRKTVKRIPHIKKFKSDLVIDVIANQSQPSNLIYNALVVLTYLMRHQSSETTFPQRLRELVETRTDDQRRAMGFPDDWRTRPVWA